MSKRETLLSKIGGGISESIGLREGENAQPTYSATSAPPRADFKRSRDVGEIKLTDIIPDPDQPRKHFDQDELENLKNSILKHGLIQAIRVRWSEDHDKWIIVAGERRYRAHQLAGLETIKASFDDSMGSDAKMVKSQQIVENALSQDLTGLELANAVKWFQDELGYTAAQCAEELCISKTKISKALALLKLPEDVQEQVKDGSISPTVAYQLARTKNPEKQKELIAKAKKGHIKSADAAKVSSKANAAAKTRTRKTTNEVFRTQDGVRIAISSRKDVGDQGMINAILEVAEEIRQRARKAA